MAWTHVVLEGYCTLEDETKNEIPECCEIGPGVVGSYCLEYSIADHSYCPFFHFGTARTTVLVTNEKGKVVDFDSYFGDLDLQESEWIKNESEWVENWRKKIKKGKNN